MAIGPDADKVTPVELFKQELNQSSILSDSYKSFLLSRFMYAQKEAFDRGVKAGREEERRRQQERKQRMRRRA